jgi:hypothetical protein
MSATLKAPDGLKNSKCEKGQLSNRPPIPYVAEMDIVTSKEEPQVLKVRLPHKSQKLIYKIKLLQIGAIIASISCFIISVTRLFYQIVIFIFLSNNKILK